MEDEKPETNEKTNDEVSKTKAVHVREIQKPHFLRLVEILKREYGYLDVSPFGAGKTHITFAICATFKLNMIVICPKIAIPNWKKYAKVYGINIIAIMTYELLRGQSGKVSHGLLYRVKDAHRDEYHATDLFDQCVRSGLLLVFDEYHKVKNENTQLASAHALVKGLVRNVRAGAKGRIALLSGTPCETKDSVTSTFKMLGIMLSDKPYNYNRSTKKYELTGIQEAIAKCNEYSPDETLAISCRSVNKTTAKTICHDLYTRVLKKYVVSSMPPPNIDVDKDVKNYYILMSTEDTERMKQGLLLFKSATNYRHEVQEVDYTKGVNWGDVTTSRMTIDAAKVPGTCRVASEQLENDPMCKVLIYCNYTNDINEVSRLMVKYNPLIVDGRVTSTEKRNSIIELFQADNNIHRVFISNPQVGGMGIDLDDKFGNRPRYTYILPSYRFTDQYQVTGRTWRDGTKSKATIRFIYSRAFPYESGILNSMALKSKVLRSMVTKEHQDLKFPGEYDEEMELTKKEKEDKIVC